MKRTIRRLQNRAVSSRFHKLAAMPAIKSRASFETLEARRLLSATIFATLIDDVNANAKKDAGENGLDNWQVYLDLNHNGVPNAGEPTGITANDGEITFSGLAPGTYALTEVLPAGWGPTPGTTSVLNITVVNGQTAEPFFYNHTAQIGTVTGTVWNDQNGDGIRGASEPGLAGWTVYVDANNNSVLDATDPSAVTAADGTYSISGVLPGQYKMREVLPAGWTPTLGYDVANDLVITAGGTATSDFANYILASGSIHGTVWNDVNADGVRAAGDPGSGGWTVFLDTNLNGILDATEQSVVTDPLGAYSFPVVIPGTVSVREVLQSGWNISPGHSIATSVTVVDATASTVDFANWTPLLGSISGTVWNDQNGDGLYQTSTEPGLSGWTVFIDQNNDGSVTAGEPAATTNASGNYTISGVPAGSNVVKELPAIGWSPTAPGTGLQLVTILNGGSAAAINFGNKQRTDGMIQGTVYDDINQNSLRDPTERGLAGIVVFLDTNNNGALDTGEPRTLTSADLFYTPAVDETGTYSFSHLPVGNYTVREFVPVEQSATPILARQRAIALLAGEVRSGVDFGNVFRTSEIHGVRFQDLNNDHARNPGEPGLAGVTMFVDLNRDNILEAGEPTTVTAADGSYSFTGLASGAYVVREVVPSDNTSTYPNTVSGILWPTGTSNPAVGNVTPLSITQSLSIGQTYHQTVSITLPGSGALTNMVDVFLLFDDTGSFTANSPIVRAAFPQIISTLQTSLPTLDLGFGTGRFEEYANFASEYGTGRPFILNQPIISSTTPGFSTAIQSGLDRTAPGYGGDQPEADIEALFQMVTGAGFDGNNNGTTTDSGAAGLISTQVTPGNSGDVPAFSSFTPDPSGAVLAASGNLGGAGFRPGALPIILTATDTGFAYQPKGETSITGVGGVTLPLSSLTQLSRNTTPFSSGAGIQETVTGLNALGALVIGLGTNAQTNLDPRQQLESLAKLTGAVNRSTTSIPNGTATPIAPGDPLYFQISSGFAASVANGVVTAIQNAVTNVAVNVSLKCSDPRVHITFTPGTVNAIGSGQTATFDVTFTGDGIPHRFDLQFVRAGTNVVLGSIPVVLGTPIVGNCYGFDDLKEGDITSGDDFGGHAAATAGGIAGVAFEDRNGNGVQNAGEPAISGASIYVDLNNSGSFDAGEPTSVTGAAGTYSFTDLSSRNYMVRQIASTGSVSTTFSPFAVTMGTTTATAVGSFPTVFTGTSAIDTFTVRSNGSLNEIWVNSPVTSAPTYSIANSLVSSITLNGVSGSDTLNIVGSVGNDTITISNSAVAVDGLNVAYSGNNQLTVDPAGGVDSLTVSSGTAQVPAMTAGGVSSRVFSTLDLAAAASLSFNSAIVQGQRTVIRTGALTVDPSAKLDLSRNDLIVQNGNYNTVSALIAAGANYATGFWNGNGITSNAAATDSTHLTSLGIMPNNDGLGHAIYTAFDGQTVSMNDVLVKYTYLGDANLDGRVDGSDYSKIDYASLNSQSGWFNGNFNYDGAINGSDYTLIDNAFNIQGASLAATIATGIAASATLASTQKPVAVQPSVVVSASPTTTPAARQSFQLAKGFVMYQSPATSAAVFKITPVILSVNEMVSAPSVTQKRFPSAAFPIFSDLKIGLE